MKEKDLEVLKLLESHGYESYIVGGYVRDYLLGTSSTDIDISTEATPKELLQVFEEISSTNDKYGSVSVIYKNIKYDITTFRREIKYESNRHPIKIKYIKDIKKDLLRRDFTINTYCINSKGEVLDILNVRNDLDQKIIKTVGNSRYRLKEDVLRILRAIRFATILDFKIEKKTKYYITKYAYLLKKLSFNRKKEELDKIFTSSNKEKGRRLLIELKLDKHLNLNNLKDIIMCDDIIGIWAQLDTNNTYNFTKNEQNQIIKIKELMKKDNISKYDIYKYGLYITTVVAQIKKLDITKINKLYSEIPITSKEEIAIKGNEIANILNKESGSYLSDILNNIEKEIINNNLPNNKEDLISYIKSNY